MKPLIHERKIGDQASVIGINFFKSLIRKIKWGQVIVAIFLTSGVVGVLISFSLHKYYPKNVPPIARIDLSTEQGSVPHIVDFDGVSSRDDLDSKDLEYTWKINGNKVSKKSSFRYVFDQVGTYRVELTVKDPGSLEGTDIVFVKVQVPKHVRTLKEALKYYQYEIGWVGPSAHVFRYYKITEVKLKEDSNQFIMKYDYGKGGVINYMLFESKRSIRGNWIEEDDSGEEELTFSQDFNTAKGWWNSDHSPNKKYEIRLRRVDF